MRQFILALLAFAAAGTAQAAGDLSDRSQLR